MEKTSLLTLENISVSLGEGGERLSILKDINIEFSAGETVAITGPSGSGKTTLMMVCAGLQRIEQGKIEFAGQRLDRMDERQLTLWRRENAGIVFQNFHLLPSATALENVMLPLELSAVPDVGVEATALLQSVGLSHRLHHRPSQLSGGEQQRVAMARALAVKPKILLADEPTGNLDQSTGEKIIALLFSETRKRGMSLILVTHDEMIAERCDRRIRLQDGQVLS